MFPLAPYSFDQSLIDFPFAMVNNEESIPIMIQTRLNRIMKLPSREKVINFLKKAAYLVLNPRFLLCFGIGWFITNGWSYVALGLGTYFGIPWLIALATGYLALLWIPFTPEKLITTAIAIALLRLLFPNDEKTLGQLRTLHASAKRKWREWLDKRNAKKEVKP